MSMSLTLNEHYVGNFREIADKRGLTLEVLLEEILMDVADDDRMAHHQPRILRRKR